MFSSHVKRNLVSSVRPRINLIRYTKCFSRGVLILLTRIDSLRGRRKNGRGGGREKSSKAGKSDALSPIPLLFSLPRYPLPLSTPATQANPQSYS